MILQRKTVCTGKGICKVELVKEGDRLHRESRWGRL